MCVIKAAAPAHFPELPAPGKAWKAMSLAPGAGRAGSPEGCGLPEQNLVAASTASPA